MNAHDPNPFQVLWNLGYRDLVPIVPPDARVAPDTPLGRRIARGYDSRGKMPGVLYSSGFWGGCDWANRKADETDVQQWFSMGAGVGIKTGNGLAAIDVDVRDPDHAALIAAEIQKTFGTLPTRIGEAPKALYLIRISDDCPYLRVEFTGSNGTSEMVEILTKGKQFVARGVHPKTRQQYRWTSRLVPFDDLPTTNAAELREFLEHLKSLLPGATVDSGSDRKTDPDQLRGDLELVRRAVRATPNTSKFFPARRDYIRYGYAVKAALPDHPHEAFDLYAEWCDSWTGPKGEENDSTIVWEEWKTFKNIRSVGAPYLYDLAAKHSGDPTFRAARWFELIDEEPIPAEEDQLFPTYDANDGPQTTGTRATPYAWPEPTAIPPRDSLYAGHYVRQYVSVTVAPSKVGKSSLAVVEALAMASGKPLLGVQPKGVSRVWWWCGEDPKEEMERRVAAALGHYGLTRDDIGDRLFLDSGRLTPIRIAVSDRSGVRLAEPLVRELVGTIQANQLDCMIVDPFVSSHMVSENDNLAIDLVAKKWAHIADETRIAVDLVHHVRKLNGGEATVEDARGAGALIAASRSARALARMTHGEAQTLKLPPATQRRLFRFTDVSSNMFLPGDEMTRWMELASWNLGNGVGDDVLERAINGDSVGVVRLFDMPGETARLVGEIERQFGETGVEAVSHEARALEMLSSGEWRKDPRAGDAWAGVPVAQAFGFDLDDATARERVKLILKNWARLGRIREVNRPNASRKTKIFIEVVADLAAEIAGDSDKLSENSGFLD